MGGREILDSDVASTPVWSSLVKQGLVLSLLQENWQPVYKLGKLSLTV